MLSFLIPTAIKGIDVSDEKLNILNNKPTYRSGSLDALSDHGLISIFVDSDFGLSNYNFPGTGTIGDPYRIENLNITVTAESAIIIRNSNVYFVIQNCYIDGNSAGIIVNNAAAGTVIIRDNVIGPHNHRGISLYICPDSLLENNTVYDAGITGIEIAISPGTVFNDNKCYNCGIYVNDNTKTDYLSYSASQNKVNDKPFGWIESSYNINYVADFYGQIALINCTNVGIYDMHLSNASIGLMAVFSDQIVVEDCSFENNSEYGIFFYLSTNSKIENCTTKNNDYGVNIIYSDDTLISNSNFTANGDGVYGDQIENLLIQNCNFFNNDWDGVVIYLTNGFEISDCEFAYSQYAGLYMAEVTNVNITNNYSHDIQEAGIWIETANNIIITQNNASANQWGVYLSEVFETNITYNLFQENSLEGVYLGADCYDNYIYLNTFDKNNGDTLQGYDEGYNNTWYNPINQEGNWWSDYIGTGNYSISGSAGAADLYPLNEQPFPFVSEYNLLISLGLLALLSLVASTMIYLRKR